MKNLLEKFVYRKFSGSLLGLFCISFNCTFSTTLLLLLLFTFFSKGEYTHFVSYHGSVYTQLLLSASQFLLLLYLKNNVILTLSVYNLVYISVYFSTV